MKKRFCFLMMLLLLLPIAVSAELQPLDELIYDTLINVKGSVRVGDYRITVDEFGKVLQSVIDEHPEIFYMGEYKSYSYDAPSMRIVTYYPTYIYPSEEIPAMQTALNAELDKIAAYAAEATDPVLQCLLANDYFCQNYRYDASGGSTDAYTLFTQKQGNSEAFAKGYMAAMNRIGIPVRTAHSDAMNRTWNMVQAGGRWYHADVAQNAAAGCGHAYLLCSDARFRGSHSGWTDAHNTACDSAAFDDAPWKQLNGAAAVRGDCLYMIDGSAPNYALIEWKNGVTRTLYGWTAARNPDIMTVYGDHIVFATENSVMAVSQTDGALITLYTAPDGMGIRAGHFDGDTLIADIGTADHIAETRTIPLTFESIDTVTLPDDTVTIEAEAFAGSAMAHFIANDALRTIGARAFANCVDLKTVTLGSGVTAIAEDAFAGCSDGLTFLCPKDSIAWKFAEAHGISCKEI